MHILTFFAKRCKSRGCPPTRHSKLAWTILKVWRQGSKVLPTQHAQHVTWYLSQTCSKSSRIRPCRGVGLEFWSENSMAGCVSWCFDCNGYMALFRHWKANLFDIQQFEKPGWQLNFCASYLLNRLGKSCCTKLLKSKTNVPLMDDNETSVSSILSNVSNELWRVWSCCIDGMPCVLQEWRNK